MPVMNGFKKFEKILRGETYVEPRKTAGGVSFHFESVSVATITEQERGIFIGNAEEFRNLVDAIRNQRPLTEGMIDSISWSTDPEWEETYGNAYAYACEEDEDMLEYFELCYDRFVNLLSDEANGARVFQNLPDDVDLSYFISDDDSIF